MTETILKNIVSIQKSTGNVVSLLSVNSLQLFGIVFYVCRSLNYIFHNKIYQIYICAS